MVHYYTCGTTAGLISMMGVKEAFEWLQMLQSCSEVALHTGCLGEVQL